MPDSPLGRASRDPIGALALLVEACERGLMLGDKTLRETDLRPYLDAGHAAVEHATEHGFWHIPDRIEAIDLGMLLDKPGVPTPHELWERTGGENPAYSREMLRYGYVEVSPKAKRCEASNEHGRCLGVEGHDDDHLNLNGDWS